MSPFFSLVHAYTVCIIIFQRNASYNQCTVAIHSLLLFFIHVSFAASVLVFHPHHVPIICAGISPHMWSLIFVFTPSLLHPVSVNVFGALKHRKWMLIFEVHNNQVCYSKKALLPPKFLSFKEEIFFYIQRDILLNSRHPLDSAIVQLAISRADPEINYEGWAGVYKGMDLITKGRGCTRVWI